MAYNITLSSSMRSNLLSLRNISTLMNKTQNILSTGKKINNAIDNASSYYQARSLTHRAADLNSLLDSMSQGIQTIQVATQGLESATAYLEQMKSLIKQVDLSNSKLLSSQVQLTNNVDELLSQGYVAIDSTMNAEDIINIIAELDADNKEIKLVLTEDVKIDDYFCIEYSGVTINGAGHTLEFNGGFDVFNEGTKLENMTLENTSIYVESNDLDLKNVNINYDYTTANNEYKFYMEGDGKLENVNINAKSKDSLKGIECWGNLDVKNLTMNLDIVNNMAIGIYGSSVNIDGMSIASSNNNVIGVYSYQDVKGIVRDVNSSNPYSATLLDGYTNTQKIIQQFDSDAKAAYATTQFYVGDKNGMFGQGKWYLPSLGELMDFYGTNYENMEYPSTANEGDGFNLKKINTTLERLGPIAEKMTKNYYWTSSECDSGYTWVLNMSTGYRGDASKRNNYYVRSFMQVENCYNTETGKPQIGDIMYLDGTWGSLDSYNTADANKVAGVICDVGDDGSVKIVSLKDLTFSTNNDSATFDAEHPYDGSVKAIMWATKNNGRYNENVETLIDLKDFMVMAHYKTNKVITVQEINNTFAKIETENYSKQFNLMLSEFDNLLADTSYQGVNLLTGGSLDVIFNESRTHGLTVKGKNMRSDNIGIKTKEWSSKDDIETALKEIDNAINTVRSYSAELGNNYTIIQTRQGFTEALTDILEEGADKLTLADMNETSAEYLMLQTRQQLAVNSLSLASQSAKSILSLF